MAKSPVSSMDRPIFERTKIRAVSLRETEYEEMKEFGDGSLTAGIRNTLEAAKLLRELGSGNYEKGKRRITAALEKQQEKMG